MKITNAFTIDVEDYFQVSAFEPYISRDNWSKLNGRVEGNIDKILQLLLENQVKATFFTLGWIAEKYPIMIRKIVANGHELASHGYSHSRVHEMTKVNFLNDITTAKKILEDVSGAAINGFRAPSFSINRQCWWAFDCIRDIGHTYSSSVYPIAHDHYGMPDSHRTLFEPVPGLVEIPISTIRIQGRNYPGSGGGYFRLLPYFVSKLAFDRLNRVDRMPVVFYFHPWEIDPDQPVVSGLNAKTKFRHYVNLGRNQKKIARLLSDFSWETMGNTFFNDAKCAPAGVPGTPS